MTVQVQIWPRGIERVKRAGPLGVEWDGEDPTSGRSVFVTDIGELVSANYSTRYEDGFGGEDIAKFSIVPNGGFVGGMFRPGDHVRFLKGGGKVADVELSEVAPTADGTVEFVCKGYAHNLDDYDSVAVLEDGDVSYPTTKLLKESGHLPTTDLFGWEWAQTIGLPINQIVGSTGTMSLYVGEQHAAEAPVKIRSVLTEALRRASLRWCVWGRTLVIAEDPDDTPKWKMDAPAGVVGVADPDYYTRVGVLYVNATVPPDYDELTVYDAGDKVVFEGVWWVKLATSDAGTAPGETVVPDWTTDEIVIWAQLPQATSPRDWNIEWAEQSIDGINVFDEKTIVVDYRGRGPMDVGDAADTAEGLLAQVKGRFTVNGSFTVTSTSGFKSANGGYAGDSLAYVHARDGIQIDQVRTTQGNVIPVFQLIGKTEWSWSATDGGDGTEQLTITPMGAVARNVSSILAGIPLQNK